MINQLEDMKNDLKSLMRGYGYWNEQLVTAKNDRERLTATNAIKLFEGAVKNKKEEIRIIEELYY